MGIFSICLFFLFTSPLSDNKVGAQEQDEFTGLKIIVIDPGHGGLNEGALSTTGVYEKFPALEIAYRLKDLLEVKHPEVKIFLTRQTDRDVGLRERINFANRMEADLFISIHLNSAQNKKATGIETYYLQGSLPIIPRVSYDNFDLITLLKEGIKLQKAYGESAILAQMVQGRLIKRADTIDRGVKQAGFTVLKGALMPAVVVELGFLSNTEEGIRVLQPEYQTLLISALLGGIEDYEHTKRESK